MNEQTYDLLMGVTTECSSRLNPVGLVEAIEIPFYSDKQNGGEI